MITGQLRSKIDKLWEEFWTGGITNPLTVIEQISFLMFARLLDMRESTEEKKWSRKNPGKPFPGVYFPRDKQRLRWSHLKQEADADKILKIVRDEVFPHFLCELCALRGYPLRRSRLTWKNWRRC